MNVSSNLQLVPYNHGPIQATPYRPISARVVPADVNPAAKRYAQMLPPRIYKNPTQTDRHESVYYPDRRPRFQKINKVGLLIDIYA